MQNECGGIVDALPGLVWTASASGEVDFTNRRWSECTGLSASEAAGSGWQVAIHPDDAGALLAGWSTVSGKVAMHERTVRVRQSDGTYCWFIVQSAPLMDASGVFIKWCCSGTNVDALVTSKRSDDDLRRSREFLEKGQRLSSTGSFLWRVGSDDIEVSDEFLRIHGFESGEPATLEKIAARVHPEDIPLLREKIELAREGGGDFDYEVRLLLPDGSIKYLHSNAYMSTAANGELEIIGATQDITERRLTDNALLEARSELERVARVMSLGALTASIAHEVSQPLSGMITNAGTCLRLLSAEPLNTKTLRDMTQRIVSDGKRASDVITRLRALFSKKSGSTECLDLNAVVRDVVALSINALRRDRVVLREELGADLPRVMGDRVQLQQVIVNLLVNAADAMRNVDDRPRQIVLKTERDPGEGVRLSVSDAGIGIEPHNERRLFEPFFTTKDGGMGIGLSISHSIVERHRGRLWATPNEGPGTTFAFTIPVRPD